VTALFGASLALYLSRAVLAGV